MGAIVAPSELMSLNQGGVVVTPTWYVNVAVWRSQQVPWKSSASMSQQNLGRPDLTHGYSSASQSIMLMLLLLESAAADQRKELPGRRTGTYRGPHIAVHTKETARSNQYSCNAHSCPYSLHSRAHWADKCCPEDSMKYCHHYCKGRPLQERFCRRECSRKRSPG